MKFTADRDELLTAVRAAAKFVRKSTLPVLENIYIGIEEKVMTIKGTNLEIGYITSLGCVAEEKGTITVPGKTMLDLLTSYPKGEIKLEITKAYTLKMSSGKSKSTIKGISAEEYPPVTAESPTATITIPRKTLLGLIRQVASAAASDEDRPILNGVNFVFKNNLLTMYTADGFRAAKAWEPIEYSGEEMSFIVPSIAINRIVSVMKDNGNGVTIGIGSPVLKNTISFSFDNSAILAQRVEGSYPDVDQIIPKKTAVSLLCNKQELQLAVKRATLFSQHVEISPNDERTELLLVSKSVDYGDCSTTVKAAIANNKLDKFGLNCEFLASAIDPIITQDVEISGNTPTQPYLVKASGEGMSYMSIVMPIHIGQDSE